MDNERFIKECKRYLDYLGVDYSGDTILLNSGHLGIIMNPKSDFYEILGGHSAWGCALAIIAGTDKKIIWKDEGY